jgi:hypothetical protein
VGQVVDLGFEGLVVLAFDLEFGLEFLYEKFQARYFGSEFLRVVAGNGARLGLHGWLRGLDAGWWLNGIRGLAGLKPGAYIGTEGFGQGAGPGGFGDALLGGAWLRRGLRRRLWRRWWGWRE